jgi:hypothetical protein
MAARDPSATTAWRGDSQHDVLQAVTLINIFSAAVVRRVSRFE